MAVAVSADPLLRAFTGDIKPVPVSLGYRLALLAVTVFTVLMPMIYVGLIGLVAWFLWWHGTGNAEIMKRPPNLGAFIFMNLLYFGPLVIGVILLVFMCKPLFARPGGSSRLVSLDPRREQRMFAFVGRLCDAVGAPHPARIDLSCEVNASASFRRGWLSFLEHDLVLTIGLNLVAGQSLRQFAGVLAHEFGHFSQGWAMRASYLIRSVNMWFARVVYQRDVLDEKLEDMSEDDDNHLAVIVILWLARGMVWLSRRILWVLMMISHMFTTLLSRHMEFDADRHAMRLVGRDAFASALRELPVLCAADGVVRADIDAAWQESRNLARIPPKVRSELIEEGLAESGGMYASHPATRDRIAAGAAEPERGMFDADGPATQLFADFAGLSKRVTLAWYADEAGLIVRPENLIPSVRIIADQQREGQDAERVERIFGPLWTSVTLFAPSGEAKTASNPAALAKSLAAADEAWVAATSAGQAPRGLTLSTAQTRLAQAAERRRVLRGELAAAAVALAPLIASGGEAERSTLTRLAGMQEDADEVRAGIAIVAMLFDDLAANQDVDRYVGSVRAEMSKLRVKLEKLGRAGGAHPYPFAPAARAITLEGYVVPELPSFDDPDALMKACQHALGSLYALHGRCLAALTSGISSGSELVQPAERARTSSAPRAVPRMPGSSLPTT